MARKTYKPEENHVWSYDFAEDRTHDGRKYRMLNLIDEFRLPRCGRARRPASPTW